MYNVKFYLYKTEGVRGTRKGSEEVTVSVTNLELASKIVDEILCAQQSGKKSAYVLHLEETHCGKFVKGKDNYVNIVEVVTKVIRKAGGAYTFLDKKNKKERS